MNNIDRTLDFVLKVALAMFLFGVLIKAGLHFYGIR